MDSGLIFYRAAGMRADEDGPMQIHFYEFILVKETPCGHWVHRRGSTKTRWISKTSRKRLAYPTKKEAVSNLVARTSRRIALLDWQKKDAVEVLYMALDYQSE